jgi:hypothetical protein
MLNVRRIEEDDLTSDIDEEEELISLGESIRFVKVMCIDDEGEDVDGFVTNLSSLIKIDSDLKDYQQKKKDISNTNYDYDIRRIRDKRKKERERVLYSHSLKHIH